MKFSSSRSGSYNRRKFFNAPIKSSRRHSWNGAMLYSSFHFLFYYVPKLRLQRLF